MHSKLHGLSFRLPLTDGAGRFAFHLLQRRNVPEARSTVRLAKNKRGKPGGVSIGEKSPLLSDARPQFLQEKVACESAAQGSLFAGRTAARLFQSLIRYVERPLRAASEDAPTFVRSCPGLLPGGAEMRPAQESNPEHELVR